MTSRLASYYLRAYRALELAVAHDPVRYQDLLATKRPRKVPPVSPGARGRPSMADADPTLSMRAPGRTQASAKPGAPPSTGDSLERRAER